MTGTALADIEPALDATAGGPLAPAAAKPAAKANALVRVRVALVGFGAAVLGVLPHVLHHVGPLAGAALLAGASGRLLFGVLGFAAMAPMLRRMRRRTGSWRAPGGLLAAMAAVFALSSFVLGPAITGSGDSDRAEELPTITVPHPSGHDGEH